MPGVCFESMINFTDNIKVIALSDYPYYNIQTRKISNAGIISTDFISKVSLAGEFDSLFLHGKNVLVFFGYSSLKQIRASTLAITDDGTLGEDWIDQTTSSGSYPLPVFAARVSDSIFAVITKYQDEVDPTIFKGYIFTYNISAEGIIDPDYVDAREISDTQIYDYTIFQVHPGIFAVTYWTYLYGDCKLETWQIDNDGIIGASPIDTLVLGSYGSRIDDLVTVSNDIFAFSLENFENILSPIDPVVLNLTFSDPSETVWVPVTIKDGYIGKIGNKLSFDITLETENPAYFGGSVGLENADYAPI